VLRYPAVWLRDNCPCAECTDPGSGQKLHDVTDLPVDCAVARAEAAEPDDAIAVTFAPDGHRSVYRRNWLAKHALDGYGDESDGKVLWDTPPPVPEASWPEYTADPATRGRALSAVMRMGFVLLRDVPADPGMVLNVAESFGFARETNYGRLFDVRIEPAPDNLAFTSREILPHTDNPYRIRCRPSSCCTACEPLTRAEIPAWWTGSRQRRPSRQWTGRHSRC
jgi:gamma-butyrobetaine dioxygenase